MRTRLAIGSLKGMTAASVNWVGGVWYLEHDDGTEPIPDLRWLAAWLSARDATRTDLNFPSAALRERFVHDFGPLTRQ